MAGAKFGALVSFSMTTFKGTRGVSSRNVSALPDVHRSEEWACLEFVAAGYCRLLVDSSAFWLPIGYAKPPFFPPNKRIYFCTRQVAVQTHATFLILSRHACSLQNRAWSQQTIMTHDRACGLLGVTLRWNPQVG